MWPCSLSIQYLFVLLVSRKILDSTGWLLPAVSVTPSRSTLSALQERRRREYYDDEEPAANNRWDYVDEPYWNDDTTSYDFPDETNTDNNDQEDYIADDDKLDWESCSTDAGTAHVLLPPPSVDRPTVVLHFVGGTFFGSSPNVWYRRLLEEIVQNTQAAVIATSIPVTLWQSPLQHVRLSRQIQRQFQTAWREVLLDEYGDELLKVPVCGLGHSLGSRLLTVLATLGEGPADNKRKQPTWKPPTYSSYILVSFTNYGAGAGIPGIYQLNRASRNLERQARDNSTRRQARQRRNNYYGNEFDEDDEEEEDWQVILQDIQQVVQDQASRVRRVLTPESKELEFHPSPEQLWKALTFDSRYSIPQTLIVQFDDDDIDQSAKLANAVKESSQIYFARLRGTHLTPVAIGDPVSPRGQKAWYDVNSRTGKAIAKLILGQRRRKYNEQASRELRQTITSYITEVAARHLTVM